MLLVFADLLGAEDDLLPLFVCSLRDEIGELLGEVEQALIVAHLVGVAQHAHHDLDQLVLVLCEAMQHNYSPSFSSKTLDCAFEFVDSRGLAHGLDVVRAEHVDYLFCIKVLTVEVGLEQSVMGMHLLAVEIDACSRHFLR